MSEYLDLNSIAIVYDGDFLMSVPKTYKAFLEGLRDKAGLTNEDFKKRTIWRGDFPILCKKDYIRLLKTKGSEGIFQIDLVNNEDDEDDDDALGEKDYYQFLEMKEAEEEIKIKLNEEEAKEDNIYINSEVNEFYAVTQVTQYYKNNNNKPVELSIIYPLKKEINFRKFIININGQKSISKIFTKEKAEEKYTDAMAGGKVGILSKYLEEEPNSYSINVGNIAPGCLVELTSEFIQYITSDDMSFCFSVMTSYPSFSDSLSREYNKNIYGKIVLKTHSKITRFVNKNFSLDQNFKREFNKEYTQCNIDFKILSESKDYNSVLSILYRTENMNEPFLLSQYDPKKEETSYIFSKIYDSVQIPNPPEPDTNFETNYYLKYQQQEKTNTPSLFIFLIDQSGSMAGSSMRIVSEAILFFLQSLTKGSYFQLIGFGSSFNKINSKPVEYNKENVQSTVAIVKELKANLGGTDISSPLKEIFGSKDYDEINLARNLFILTDGEVNNREECLGLIASNSEKFKVHAIGIGSSFDKLLIQNAGIQGRGTYHFVQNVSDVNSIIIESLSKCLRNYALNTKINLEQIKPEYEFTPKMNFIYPDEILNYCFIIKGKEQENNIQINLENSKKKENYIFSKDKIIKEEDGEILGQIIIGNILKNQEKMEEEIEVKLSKEYQILSKKTSLFAVAENDEKNKVGELKQITKKKKLSPLEIFQQKNNMMMNNNNMNNRVDYDMVPMEKNILFEKSSNRFKYSNMESERRNRYDLIGSAPRKLCKMAAPSYSSSNRRMNMAMDMEDNDDDEDNNVNCMAERKESPLGDCFMAAPDDDEDEDRDEEQNKLNLFNSHAKENKEMKKEEIKEKKMEEKKVEFSNKELILTQDIFDGFWNLNEQTKLLIEKEKDIYDKIENILKEKKIEKEEVKMTLLVLYYLNTNDSINKVEYMLIIKKATTYLEENGIKFEEIFSQLKN